jgi:hypothetical protein
VDNALKRNANIHRSVRIKSRESSE